MRRSAVYLSLCVIGVLIPWLFLVAFLGEPHPSVSLFVAYIFANHVSGSVAADLLISALIFFVFVFAEGKRINMNNLWLYIPATLLVGLSFGTRSLRHRLLVCDLVRQSAESRAASSDRRPNRGADRHSV